MNMRTAIVAVLLVVGACGDSAESDASKVTAAPQVTTTGAATTAVPPATSSRPPVPTTRPPETTSTSAPVARSVAELSDGRPATFVAATDDFRAVEVDTVTGAVIADYGRVTSEEDLAVAGAEDIYPNIVDAVWRTNDGEWVVVSECCEPAGGVIHYLADGQVLTPGIKEGIVFSDGWTVGPSPFSGDVAVLGYFLQVGDVGELSITREIAAGDSFPGGVPAWSRSGDRVHWLSSGASGTLLNTTDLDDDAGVWESVELDWVGGEQRLEGLATQATGNLVAFLVDSGGPSTTGVVFTPAGELVASFPVEDGSRLGGYDPTGRFLIYVDGDGNARWQGLGRSGVLGDGFIHASW